MIELASYSMGKHVERTGDSATTFQYALPLEKQGVVATEKKGFFGWIKGALAGEVQSTVVWEADRQIEPVPAGTQRGFFMNDDGTALHSRPQEGDRMIKTPKKKEKKPRGSKSPFAEVQAYKTAEAARADGHGTHTFETVNGGERIDLVGRKGTQRSPVGEEGYLFQHTYAPSETAQGPRYRDLSEGAKRLLRSQDAEEKKRSEELKRQARENERQARVASLRSEATPPTLRISLDSIFPAKREEGVRWETLRRMVEEARKALK